MSVASISSTANTPTESIVGVRDDMRSVGEG